MGNLKIKIRRIAAIMLVIVFLLCGCGAKATGAADIPLPTSDGAKEITVEVSCGSNFYADAAKAFEKKTGVKVNVINHIDNENKTSDGNFYDKAITEMTAGKGADIYSLNQLQYQYFSKKNLIVNIKGWIDTDKDFTNDKYFMKIIKGSEENGKIYAIPLSFYIDKLGADAAVPEMEKIGSCTWEQFFEKAKDIPRRNRLLNSTDVQVFWYIFKAKAGDFIDTKNRTQKLDSPEMIALLKQCKGWSDAGLCIKTDEDYPQEDKDRGLFSFDLISDGSLGYICKIAGLPADAPAYYDMPSDYTEDKLEHDVHPGDMAVVNAASKKKATVWKFLKFLLDNDMQLSDEFYNIPVNKGDALTRLQVDLGVLQTREGVQFDMAGKIKEGMAYLDGIKRFYTDPMVLDIAMAEVYPFFEGKISAEESAKQMAAKVGLYLKEQN